MKPPTQSSAPVVSRPGRLRVEGSVNSSSGITALIDSSTTNSVAAQDPSVR